MKDMESYYNKLAKDIYSQLTGIRKRVFYYFIKFLKNNNVFELYFSTMEKLKHCNIEYISLDGEFMIDNVVDLNTTEFFLRIKSYNYIGNGFVWKQTKEGYQFWSTLSREWSNFYRKYFKLKS